jgi:acetyl-CoA carboxylase biotin carboxyl carrier protein
MTLEEIQQLIDLAQRTGVAELEVQRGENRVRVKLLGAATEVSVPAQPSATRPSQPLVAPLPSAAALEADANVNYVKSPIVGTFYESPSPGAAPFVNAGDTIRAGQILCIVESMKLMNEIESEISGVITARLVDNGHAVEYGAPLFAVRPA